MAKNIQGVTLGEPADWKEGFHKYKVDSLRLYGDSVEIFRRNDNPGPALGFRNDRFQAVYKSEKLVVYGLSVGTNPDHAINNLERIFDSIKDEDIRKLLPK